MVVHAGVAFQRFLASRQIGDLSQACLQLRVPSEIRLHVWQLLLGKRAFFGFVGVWL